MIDSTIKKNYIDTNHNFSPSSLLENLRNDIWQLRNSKSEDFKNESIENLLKISQNKKAYQQQFKNSSESKSYQEFRKLYQEARQALLPFRLVDLIKQGGYLEGSPNLNLPKDEKKLALKQWEGKLLGLFKSELWELASKINWLHGTNSSILPFLPKTDFCLIPTGKLLEKGIAPMSGEIKNGISTNGINQSRISVVTLSGIPKCLDYADRISRSFYSQFLDDPKSVFSTNLGRLERMTPEDIEWESTIISLYQLKQWVPEIFQKLIEKNQERIKEIKNKSIESLSLGTKEGVLLNVINYDNNELLKARTDENLWERVAYLYLNRYGKRTQEYWLKNLPYLASLRHVDHLLCSSSNEQFEKIVLFKLFYKEMAEEALLKTSNEEKIEELKKIQAGDLSSILGPFQVELEKRIKRKLVLHIRRLERLEKLFDPHCLIQLSESDKNEISKPFPIVLASTKLKSSGTHFQGSEYHVLQPKLGKDIDLLFAPQDSLSKLHKWLTEQGLDKEVHVYPTEILQKLMQAPLKHSVSQISLYKPYIGNETAEKIDNIVKQHVIKLYQAPFINNQSRIWHGVSHALRVLFFSHVIGSLYHEAGFSFSKQITGDLQIAAALHDCARENDGKDLWDRQSGMKCKQILLENGADECEGALFEKAIAEKDNKFVDCVEQKVIHDADCLDIIRCLHNLEDFDPAELWISKDLNSDQVTQLISEAKLLIKLTDTNQEIKNYIENSSDPLMCLYQIVFHINTIYGKLEMLTEHIYGSKNFFDKSENYLLNEKIEKVIKENL